MNLIADIAGMFERFMIPVIQFRSAYHQHLSEGQAHAAAIRDIRADDSDPAVPDDLRPVGKHHFPDVNVKNRHAGVDSSIEYRAVW